MKNALTSFTSGCLNLKKKTAVPLPKKKQKTLHQSKQIQKVSMGKDINGVSVADLATLLYNFQTVVALPHFSASQLNSVVTLNFHVLVERGISGTLILSFL